MNSPVEYKHVEAQSCPGQPGHHGCIESFFVREHPGLLRHGEVEVVPVPVPEEDVLQGGAPSLVSLSKGNLQIHRQDFCDGGNMFLPVSLGSTDPGDPGDCYD